jgi:hypothetical protein
VGRNDRRVKINVKVKLFHYRHGSPSGYGSLRLPEFADGQHMKVIRLSAIR